MNLKNEKGITMITVIIIIILLILLGSVTVYYAQNLIKEANTEALTTNLLLIQAQVRIINEKVVFEKDEEEKANLLKGTKLSESPNVITKVEEKNIIPKPEENSDEETEEDEEEKPNEYEKYYVLSQKDLNDMGLDTISSAEGYIVNYETEEVICLNGVKDSNGNLKYKLSDVLKAE